MTLINSSEAARRLATSDAALRKSRSVGELWGLPAPLYIKIGRTVRYDTSELDAWISLLPRNTSFAAHRAELEL